MKPHQFSASVLAVLAAVLFAAPASACWRCHHHHHWHRFGYGYGTSTGTTRPPQGGGGQPAPAGAETPVGNEAAKTTPELGAVDLLDLVIKVVGGDRDKVVVGAVRDLLNQPAAGGAEVPVPPDQAIEALKRLSARLDKVEPQVQQLQTDVEMLKRDRALEAKLDAILEELRKGK